MEEYAEKLLRIKEFLHSKHPARMSISAISRELGMRRSSVSKYLDMLQLPGDVAMVPFGKSKLYTISQRVPYNAIFDVSPSDIVILDSRGHIEMANKKFAAEFEIDGVNRIIGFNVCKLETEDIFRPHDPEKHSPASRRSAIHQGNAVY